MRENQITLIQKIPSNWLTAGFILSAARADDKDLPWSSDDDLLIDIDLVTRYSQRIISPIVEAISPDTAEMTSEQITNIARVAFLRFGDIWRGLYKTLTLEYNPLENYSMTETSERVRTSDNTSTTSSGVTNKINGFDSSNPVDSDSSTGYNDGTSIGNETDNNTLTRSGNIGVTTSQEMIEAERKVRQYDFYKTVSDNIASLITIPYYGGGKIE